MVFALGALVLLCTGAVKLVRREWKDGWLMIGGAVLLQVVAAGLAQQH